MALVDTGKTAGSGSLPRSFGVGGVLPLYALTIFLSAFLLFSVQPMFAKMVLPVLGGSPGVWSVAMVFFQATLLAGYAYAHFLTTRLSLRTAGAIHLVVLLTAFVFLPLALPAGWATPPESGHSLWLLGLMAVSIGLPFFAVAANSPLLQAWFARTGHDHAADPYFLYGSSNIGSFASLILYILLFEPAMTLPSQSFAWAIGFAVLTLAVALCLLRALSVRPASKTAAEKARAEVVEPSRRAAGHPLQWIALAFVPSGLLVAVTAHISTDIAAAPFLWVIPLALFLLTFVIAFARRPLVTTEALSPVIMVLGIAVLLQMTLLKGLSVAVVLPLHLSFFFAAALIAHSFLVSLRPEASRLTAFYLWMSFGGVLGGAVTTLVSPLLFDIVIEYPLLVVAALLCRPSLYEKRDLRIFGLRLPLMAAALGVTMVVLAVGQSVRAVRDTLFIERSFFGVVRVFDASDSQLRVMKHGSTYHGVIRSDETGRPTPLAYYHASGGIARALFAAQEKIAGQPSQMGVVGLGSGSILCHRKPGERWTSFEIDRAVVAAASDPHLFRFVSACGEGDPIVIGDGRITLKDEADGTFDYLLIDAFSSDSIPAHLMTLEAFQLYRTKMKPDGILAVHISNRYLELKSVLAATVARLGMVGRFGAFKTQDDFTASGIFGTHVVVLAASEAALGSLADDPAWEPLTDVGTQVWTDDFSNLPAAIWRHWRARKD